jgi:hypothetical protein
MAEWFKAAVLKTASPKGDVGSNPTPSAMHHVGCMASPEPHMVQGAMNYELRRVRGCRAPYMV